MNSSYVKVILEKRFGASRKTLTLNGKSKSNSCTYYYTLPNEPEILKTRDVLDTGLPRSEYGKIEELTQMYPSPPRGRNSDLQCACITEYGSDSWSVCFYEIIGIRYHRSFGGHIAASVILGKKPVVALSSDVPPETFYGFWGRTSVQRKEQSMRGMSYWANKNMYFNLSFRAFAVDFFFHEAVLTKRFILKDIARTIEKYGYLLLPIPYAELCKYHTPKELFNSVMPLPAELGRNVNAVDLNLAYVVSTLISVTARRDLKYLKMLPEELVHNSFSLNALFEGLGRETVVSGYYQYALRDEWCDDEDVAEYAKDYGHMCIANGVEIRLGYSYQGLIKAHDEVSKLDRMRRLDHELEFPLLPEQSRFDVLERCLEDNYPGEFERIKDARRLFQEGEQQHNCVFSRRFMIREDRVSVYHWDYDEKNYTIQFGIDEYGLFYIQEIKGRFNESCSPSVMRELSKRLSYVQQ